LRERLRSGAAAADVMMLHRRASAWFAHQELWSEAIQHALAAQDWSQAADVIEQHGRSIMFGGQIHTVIDWMTMLPEALIQARPGLCV
jgi:LuxR family maltose regulon positive regulatory protein